MTEDPYRNVDDIISEIDKATSRNNTQASSASRPGPQPVTGPTNPFRTRNYTGEELENSYVSQDSTYSTGPSYYQGTYENPFLNSSASSLVPARRQLVAPPERQRHLQMHKINTWLSVFFPIASVIFYFIDRGKERLYDQHLRETMNMGITRLLIAGGASFFSGWLATMFGLASIAYFVLALLGAFEATNKYIAGSPIQYKGAIPFTRKDD